MNLKDFSNLIEIQSLQSHQKKHLNEIASQESRINSLIKKKCQTLLESTDIQAKITEIKPHLTSNENALNALEKRIGPLNSNRMMVKTTEQLLAIDKELATVTSEKGKLENIILEQMETLSNLEDALSTFNSFLSGIDKSIQEIQTEVNQTIKEENIQISNYQERISELIKNIPSEAKEIFSNVNKKHKYNSPITLINNNACSKCNYPIDRNLASLIEKGTMLELCPGCERLLAPHNTQYLSSY